jgi:shikimate dehydrogenase
MRKACVIGWPVAHSLSPALHTYWLKRYNIEGSYTAEEVQSERLAAFLKNMQANGFSGCNVTTPHKAAVIPFLDEVDALASSIGAVNTIIAQKGKLRGTNTDAFGFTENLRMEGAFSGKKNKAVVLGAGGAAKAVVKSLVDVGFADVMIINRTQAKAEQLQLQYGEKVITCDWEYRDEALEGTDLLVNTTSLGLKGKEPLEVSLQALPKSAIIHDIVYNPLMTPLLIQGKENGNRIIDGLGMLLYQAVPAFEAWFGKRPEVDAKLRHYMVERLA